VRNSLDLLVSDIGPLWSSCISCIKKVVATVREKVKFAKQIDKKMKIHNFEKLYRRNISCLNMLITSLKQNNDPITSMWGCLCGEGVVLYA